MEPKRTYYYSDELNDDFAGTKICTRKVGSGFTYAHTSLLWRVCSSFLYYCIILPIVVLINKLWFGLRIEGKRNLRKIDGGYFMYGNHTRAFTDATAPAMMAFPRKAYVIAGADAVSVRGISWLVQMVGGLILPNELSGSRKFAEAVELRSRKAAVMIYPEAHLWPFYTKIRPFSSASFKYPVKHGRPVVAVVTTYRRRKTGFLPPAVTITISEPYYPDNTLGPWQSREQLRNRVYDIMCSQTHKNEVEYFRYIKKER
jgi:1-acyl-sn-glycerol-3-phosphate acyltransferase